MLAILIIVIVGFALVCAYRKGSKLRWWWMLAVLLVSLALYTTTSLLIDYLLFEVFEIYNAKASLWDLILMLLPAILPLVVAITGGSFTMKYFIDQSKQNKNTA